MQHTMTTTPHINTTINLILRLEGLEVLLLTEEDHFDFMFCLRPNTIHCCLSFTEGCHGGMPICNVRYMNDLMVVMDWAHDWIANTLIPDSVICNKEKAQVVDKYEEAV
jgi:hypothetical protein